MFVGSAIAIYLSCDFFVNGIEWVGHRLKVSQAATGTILAAFGTALPESVVTFAAVVFGTGEAERDIGVGAALGGPLALSTLAYCVVGLVSTASAPGRAGERPILDIDARALSRDQAWFLGIFIIDLALGLVAFAGKRWFGLFFLAIYAIYARKELRDRSGVVDSEALEPLKLRPRDARPSLLWASLQTGVALAVIFVASRLFVHQLEAIGPWLGLPPQVTALLLSPIATEMPEIVNAVIWVRQGKQRMALANISGSMMIQATIPSALGLLFTPWRFNGALVLASLVTTATVAALFLAFRGGRVSGKALSLAVLPYIVFAGLLILLRRAGIAGR